MTRWYSDIAANIVFAVAIYFGALQGITWIGYAVIAFVWFMLVAHLGAMAAGGSVEKLRGKVRAYPRWVGYLFDVAVTVAFLATQWYWTALVYVLSSICAAVVYARVDALPKGVTSSQPEVSITKEEAKANFRHAARGDASALKRLEKFAMAGHANAEFLMGRLYDVSNEKKSIAADLAAAKEWYEKAAAQGHPLAQYALGNMYDFGEGIAQDHKQGRRWYEAAAKQGIRDAQMHFGRMLQTGRGGHQSNAEAASWYSKAAEQGDELAATNLAQMHLGREIENASDAEAFALLSYSAEKLDGLAHLMLGEMYLEGKGVEQEGERALFHYSIATLILPGGQNKESAVTRREMILKQFPQYRSRVDEMAYKYIKERGGTLPQ